MKEYDGEQEGNKEDGEWVLSVHLFGKCHDLRLIGNQEWVNEGGDIDIDIHGLNVNGFLAYIRDADDLLNRQKKQKGDILEVITWKWRKRKKVGGENNKRQDLEVMLGGAQEGRYGDDGMKIVGLLGKLCEKQAQVVASDPLLMLVKGEIISDWYWNNVCEEINDWLEEFGSELLVNVLEPRIGSLLKGRLEGGQLYTPSYVAQVSVNGIEVLLISSTTLVFDPGGVKVFGGWDCKEGMRAYDKCLGLNTECWFKKDIPRLCIEKYLKMFCEDAKESGVSIVSLNFEHGKWKFDIWRWPNTKKKWEETCYGRWDSKRGPEFTWEREDYMKSKYPQLFADRADESAS
ncbi:E3 UFM1-protein ligase 1 [Tanacetum coccineum]